METVMTDRAVQPEAPLSDSEKLRGLALWFDAFDKGTAGAVSRVVFSEAPSDEVQRDLRRIADELEARAASQERPRRFAALMETDALSDDRFASQERSQPDYRPEFPNECGWVGALGWADYETPNGRPCTLPDDHEGPHQRNPVGASQERPSIDVERLAVALISGTDHPDMDPLLEPEQARFYAERIAAEYARLSRPTDGEPE
jgi:hypothetical protein